MSKKYTIGIDFGTLSARAVLTDIADGGVIADSVFEYPHGVMDTHLCGEAPLPADFALQHPADYVKAVAKTVPEVLEKSGVSPADVVGVGFDATSCTVIPVKADGTPLCFDEKFKDEPHAYVKLWKHHAAQEYADRFNAALAKYEPKRLELYGGKTSAEWLFPKIMETLDKAPRVYDETAYFMEIGDFLSFLLTGAPSFSYSTAAYKALYSWECGYPSRELFASLDKRLENVVEEKLNAPIIKVGEMTGRVCDGSRAAFGLPDDAPWFATGTAVACSVIDAHSPSAALNAVNSGDLLASLGTSSCYILMGEGESAVSGICGVARDGIIPSLYSFEAGLCCFGDHFAWAAENLCTAEYVDEARERGISAISLLSEKAARLSVGESGIIALNWWNGNRNILIDSSLSGMFLGMTLQTRPEDMLRALIEANAFGTRNILDNFENSGVEVKRIIASGGIASKSPFIMQLMADVTGKEIFVSDYLQTAALGAAIYAATASGEYPSVTAACEKMSVGSDTVYKPRVKEKAAYDLLYEEYITLHDYFGRGGNDVMKKLRKIREDSKK